MARAFKVLKSVADVRDINAGAHGEGALDEPRSLRWYGEPRPRKLVDRFAQTDVALRAHSLHSGDNIIVQ
jgi:hypothetical protein